MLHDCALLNRRSRYIYMQPSFFQQSHVVRLEVKNGAEGQTTDGNTARLYSTSIQQGRIFMAIDIRQVRMYDSYHLYSCLVSTLERQKGYITIADLQATFQCCVAAHCNCIFLWIFLHVTIRKFGLHISMNYTENIVESFVHARAVDTRYSSLIFVEHLGTRLHYSVLYCPQLLPHGFILQ